MFSFFRGKGAGASDALTPEEFNQKRRAGDVVIDVRTPQEFASGHVAGAVNLDVHAPSFRSDVEQMDRDGRYYLYCRSGSRSGSATRLMRQLGFKESYNVGGVSALARAGVRIER